MTALAVNRVGFEEYETDIKENWISAFLEFSDAIIQDWIEEGLADGKDGFEEIAEWDLSGALDQLYKKDIQNFKHEDVVIVGLVNTEQDELIGGSYTHILDDETRAKINRLWVPEHHRGNGYGEMMFQENLKAAKERDVDVVRLSNGDPFRGTGMYLDYGFEHRGPFPSSTVPDMLLDHWNFLELRLD